MIWNISGRYDVDITESGAPFYTLKMKKGIKMVGTEVKTGPMSFVGRSEDITFWTRPLQLLK